MNVNLLWRLVMVRDGIDWEGMSLHDKSRYLKIREVLNTELEDNLVNMGDEEFTHSLKDRIESDFPRSRNNNEQFVSLVMRCLHSVTTRESLILRMRHGLGEYDREHTLSEISEVIGVTPSRIGSILTKSYQRFRHPLRRVMIKPLYDSIQH